MVVTTQGPLLTDGRLDQTTTRSFYTLNRPLLEHLCARLILTAQTLMLPGILALLDLSG